MAQDRRCRDRYRQGAHRSEDASSRRLSRARIAAARRATRPSPISGSSATSRTRSASFAPAINIRRYLDKHILPAWGGRDFATIRRTDVAKLLDHVEDNAGPVAADLVLCVVRSISNWYATRDDNYVSPVVRGMRRSKPKERARDRILNDDELRAVWKAAESNGVFGAFVRLALLTGQRKEKVASMRWEDIDGSVWHVPSEEREKGNAGDLELPQIALDIINAQPALRQQPLCVLPAVARDT